MAADKNVVVEGGTIPARERVTIDDAWRDFNRDAIPTNAPPGQRREMKRAFYAGAISFFGCMNADLDPDHEPTEFDIEHLSVLVAQLEKFRADLVEGRA